MKTPLLNEILACLPADRTVFRYAQDDYALTLLSHYIGNGKRISDIKRSPYRGLLEKPAVKQLIAGCGQGILTRTDVSYASVSDRQNFVLTAGKWDRDHPCFSQTTRNSANLVLQMNFNSGHDRVFHQLIGNGEMDYFRCDGHPVFYERVKNTVQEKIPSVPPIAEHRYYRNTLGWARLDLDFDTGEVLIEEIQNDWLRRAKRYLKMMTAYIAKHPDYKKRLGITSTPETISHYVKQSLAPFYRMWDEAILTAVIKFCVEELGIRYIYSHTFDTGNCLKRIVFRYPPRSLYTDLPRKFCFTLTDEAPAFLTTSKVVRRKLKKVKNPRWYQLTL